MAPDKAERPADARLLEGLEDGLRRAKRAFDGAVDGKGERLALMVALEALHELARIIAPNEALDVPIARLVYHLASLDDNFVAPMLKPAKRGGRPSSVDDEIMRGRAAAALELFIRSGDSPTQAAAQIAKQLREAGYTINRGGVLGWRKAAREGRGTDVMRDRYSFIVAGNAHDKDLRAAAQHVIQTLCERGLRRKER